MLEPASGLPTAETVIKTLNESGVDGLGSQASTQVFDEKFIKTLKNAGQSTFHVWTVDDPDVARLYQEHGAFGITTNRPALIRHELAKSFEDVTDAIGLTGLGGGVASWV